MNTNLGKSNKLSTLIATLALIIALLSATGGALAGARALEAATSAGAPTVVSYQGKVTLNGAPYTGTGYFKFVVVSGAGHVWTSHWSNDGTSSGGSQPTVAVPLTVSNGLFTVLLGHTALSGMTQPLEAIAFNGTSRSLRVWFSSDNVTFTQLADQRVAAVPYALQASEAMNADTLDGLHGSAYQLLVSGSCAVGSTIRAISFDGSVECQEDAPLNRGVAPTNNTISTLDSVNFIGRHSSITIGADGLGLISYYDDTNGNLKVAHCTDVNCYTADIYTLDSGGNVGGFTSIAIGANGRGLISYYDYTNGDLKVAACNDTPCSSATISTLDSAGNVGHSTSITIGASGRGLISYVDLTNNDLKVAYCGNTNCTGAAISTIDNGAVNFGTSIAVSPSMIGVIGYYRDGNLYFARCVNFQCSTANLRLIYDGAYALDTHVALAIGTDMLPIIASYSEGLPFLVHCDAFDCSSYSDTWILDLTGDTGKYPSITIGADGLAMSVYYDATNGALKTARCTDVQCSLAGMITLYQTDSAVFLIPSVTLGSDGLLLISFYDSTDYDLQVLHCGSIFCASYWRRR